ncbi:MAG: tyrosine-protein phosphatase [Rhodobacteraceae bacterium]|nr:tyrosine-protein phosphatase [Paracoccaceae bacterium]
MLSDPPTCLMPSLGNFRDLGGVSLGGRRLKHGLFFRSPRLTDLSDTDLAWLNQQNIETIVDFRGKGERNAAPLMLGTDLMARRLSLPIEPTMGNRLRKLSEQNQRNDAAASTAITASYRAYVQDNLDVFAAFLQICARSEGAVVFHCSAGKDRTGFAAALLLSALGASWDDIIKDYLRTRTDWQIPHDIRAEASAAGLDLLLGVEPCYLEGAFHELYLMGETAKSFAHSAVGGAKSFEQFFQRVTEPLASE